MFSVKVIYVVLYITVYHIIYSILMYYTHYILCMTLTGSRPQTAIVTVVDYK